jgi:F-type H+-transporting ATPase subunit delta
MKAPGGYIERVYAGSLFELADQSGIIDTVKDDLDSWTAICSAEEDFDKLIISPYFSSDYKQQLVHKVFAGKIADMTLNFLAVVIRHNRTAFLKKIIEEFHVLWLVREGYCDVQVTISEPPDNQQRAAIAAAVAEALERKTRFQFMVDPAIIGGVIISYDDKVIDNTVRTRMNEIVETILKRGKKRKINEV